jgi:predicted kinase
MLVARATNGVLILGLARENVDRLRDDHPMFLRPETHALVREPIGIVYGETEDDIAEQLRNSGLLGGETQPAANPYRPTVSAYRKEAPEGRILLLTVGLPRSGKSTWAQSQAWPVVCPDAVRLALHGQAFYAPAEPLVWAHARLMVRSLFLAGHRTVIVDATSVTRKRRQEWASPGEWLVATKEFPAGKEECLARARGERDDLVPVIERMAAAYEAPGPDEYPWP